jgi:alpha-L-rhamnosidase
MAPVPILVLLALGLARGSATAVTRRGPSGRAAPVELKTEHAREPLDVDVAQPRLSWQLDGDRGGVVQRAYQIAIASHPSVLRSGRADVWDSGKVVSPAETDVPYAGPALASKTTYFWAVRVWTMGSRSPGAWSRPARFETGLFSPSDWTATWIGRDNPPTVPVLGEQPRAPLLRKEFALEKSIARARLRIVGLGYYVAYINGRRIGDAVLDPPPTAFNETALYATYDVTDRVRRGENAIGVILGRGYFGAPTSHSFLGLASAPWRSEPRLLAQLDVTYEDGTTTRVVSDGTWTMTDGPIMDSAWHGEHYDARLEQPGWSRPGFDASGWTPAHEQPARTRKVLALAMEQIENAETLRPVSASTPAPGVTVYDFGRVTAGWALISTRGEAGTKITLTYGETLLPDGTVARFDDQAHVDSYTLRGGGRETWEPRFARHGFRYIQISSAPSEPDALRVRARVNHTAVPSTGRFESASDLLDQLHANQRATVLANLWGFPTDTPWRDRMGWTADAWLFLDSAALNFGVQRLYSQWLRTYRESQSADGSLPVIAPAVSILGASLLNDPSWSGTIVLDAWALYQHYGDAHVLTDNYEAMARWMDRMATAIAGTGNVYRGFSFGDWATPGSDAKGATLFFPPEGSALTATADLYQEARTLARIAAVLGRSVDVTKYDALADQIKTAFNATFFDAAANTYRTNVAAGYRQTSNLMPLAYGLVPTDREEAVYANLVADIRSRGDHLNTGAIGTKQLLPVLTEHGDGELAYTIATQTTYPSWGYWLAQGATSSWETWSHTGPGQSENHAFLGTFDDWLYTHLAGIQAAEPGYATVRIKPVVPTALAHASASVGTPRGDVASAWRRSGGTLTLSVAIPGNTTAEVHVPAGADDHVRVTGRRGVRLLRRENGYAVFAAGSGRHVFKVRESTSRGSMPSWPPTAHASAESGRMPRAREATRSRGRESVRSSTLGPMPARIARQHGSGLSGDRGGL